MLKSIKRDIETREYHKRLKSGSYKSPSLYEEICRIIRNENGELSHALLSVEEMKGIAILRMQNRAAASALYPLKQFIISHIRSRSISDIRVVV